MEDKNVQKLLDMLYGMIDEAKGATFSSEKCVINRDEALDLLDERERTVIVLRFFQELKLQEIAQVTGENVNTVKTILYRSLKKLKLELSEGGPIRESRPSRSSETGI